MQTVSVVPADVGWAVRSDAIDNEMMFISGAKAEESARRLAQALAKAGDLVEVRIHVRGGDLAGRFFCLPPYPLSYDARFERCAPPLPAPPGQAELRPTL
jgi:hypothetical protein